MSPESTETQAAAAAAQTAATEPAANTDDIATLAAKHFPSDEKSLAAATAADPGKEKAGTEPQKQKPSLFPKKPAPAAATEKKEETPAQKQDTTDHPEDKLELPNDTKPDTKNQFAALKTTAKQLRSELETLRAEHETLKQKQTAGAAAATADADDIAKLRAEHAAMRDRLALTDIQSHPDYVAQYIAPRDKALSAAADLLKENGLSAPDMHAILAKPRAEFGKAVSELAGDLPEFDRAEFLTTMRDAYVKNSAAAATAKNSAALSAELQARNAQAQRDTAAKVWNEKIARENEFLVELPAPDDKATPEQKKEVADYNAALARVRSDYEKYTLSRIGVEDSALLAGKAATLDFLASHGLPRIERLYQAMQSENETLRAEVEALRAARAPGQFNATESGSTAGGDNKSIEELAKEFFKH